MSTLARIWIAAGTAVVLAVATATTVSIASVHLAVSNLPSITAAQVDTTGFPTGGNNPGIFTDTCTLSKTAPNDPILMPGMTGLSMQHNFFGNPAVNANSEPSYLVGGTSTCTTSADASAYWTPVVFQNGKALAPSQTLIYWRSPAATASKVSTMPPGMTMIAGNEAASSPQSDKIINWTCTASLTQPAPKPGETPRDCAAGQSIRLVVTFPNCWDGKSLDGKHQTNVEYADASGACPSSHPVQIPQVVMHIAYPTSTANNLTLSIGPTQQGPTTTGHADFMSGWNQSVMNADVAACIDTQTRCGRTLGPLATPQGGRPAGG